MVCGSTPFGPQSTLIHKIRDIFLWRKESTYQEAYLFLLVSLKIPTALPLFEDCQIADMA